MIRTMRCNNPNSRFKGSLDLSRKQFRFVFNRIDENCYWPVNSSLYELFEDGWTIV